MLNWDALGIYKAFSVSRNGKVITDSLPGNAEVSRIRGDQIMERSHAVQPINGTVTLLNWC